MCCIQSLSVLSDTLQSASSHWMGCSRGLVTRCNKSKTGCHDCLREKLEVLISYLDLNTRINQVQELFDWRQTDAFQSTAFIYQGFNSWCHLSPQGFKWIADGLYCKKFQAVANRSAPLATDFFSVAASYVMKYSVIHNRLQRLE